MSQADPITLSRREFLTTLAAGPLAAAGPDTAHRVLPWLFSRPPRRVPRPFIQDGQSVLVVVEGRDPARMLAAGLEALPGFVEFIRPRRELVIKPNATAGQPYPVTTDAELLRVLLATLTRLSPGHVTLCDSPSFAGLAARRVFSTLRYFDLADPPRVAVRVIDPTCGSGFARVTSPNWRRHSALLTHAVVQDADCVINVAVPKRHHASDFSCALKNCFGCTYDTFRTLAHLRLERDADGARIFDESLADCADAVRPDLTIVDARSLLTRAGPTFRPGRSVIARADRLVISADLVAVDAYCARLLETHDETFHHERRVDAQLAAAARLGLGTMNLGSVTTLEIST
jgi:uncharacterized protein (DUF362 family)